MTDWKPHGPLSKHITKLRELENDNQHPEWLIYYAEHLARDRKLAAAARAALALQDHFGSLTRPLQEIRRELYAQAKFLFEQRDPEGFKLARAGGV